jgi:hypothetical protein
MCRYALQDQPRPRRCVELREPCDECATEEQAKMDTLWEEHAQKQCDGSHKLSFTETVTVTKRT